jgi:hypothetical protein
MLFQLQRLGAEWDDELIKNTDLMWVSKEAIVAYFMYCSAIPLASSYKTMKHLRRLKTRAGCLPDTVLKD